MATYLKFELKVIGAKNIETKHKCNLFIRCYLSTGSDNTRIQLNTKEVTSYQKDDYIFWDDLFSLECNGTDNSILNLKQQSVFFELRWRNTKPFLGKIGGSQLLATAEMPWKNVFDAHNMEIQRWVYMTVSQESGCKLLKFEDGVKPPALQVAMKIEVPQEMSVDEMRKVRRRERLMRWDECGCRVEGGCCSTCVDNELLLVGVALDDF